MKYTVKSETEERTLVSVLPNAWGTIGPWFQKSSLEIGAFLGKQYGLMVYSPSAALETVLRGWNIGFGSEVIVAGWSDPMDAMVTAAVGAVPVFADICEKTMTLTAETVNKCVTDRTRAVIADLPCGNPCDAAALKELCSARGLYLILNLDDAWGTCWNGEQIASFADAAIVNLSQDKVVDLGLAGAVVTDDPDWNNLFYAYHNCGRPFGDGSNSLSFDAILGGDMRITEWQASMVSGRLAQLPGIVETNRTCADALVEKKGLTPVHVPENGTSSRNGILIRREEILKEKDVEAKKVYPAMHLQPFFRSDYFCKQTGVRVEQKRGSCPVSEWAAENILRL